MSTRIQISDKRGDAILLVTTEGEVPEQVEAEFAAAAGLLGLGTAYESFGIPNPVATVPAAAIVTRPQVPAAAYQQQAPQAPAAPGGKLCDRHGLPMQYKSGSTNGRDWAFWGCTGPSNDRCDKVWA
jgi:hypothetical protein